MDDTRSPNSQSTLNASFFDVLRSIREEPAELGSADAGRICKCEDGSEYVIKDGVSKNSTPEVPHCEWFCSELGEAIQIAIPRHKIIRLLDGSHVFGSHIVGGLINPDKDHAGYWFDLVRDGIIDFENATCVLSRIYAFDHFIHNVDRHKGNFLVHKQISGYSIYAMDYSRAWIRWGFPTPEIPMGNCNTVNTQRSLRDLWRKNYIEPSEVEIALHKIRSITVDRIKRIIEDHPPEWLPKSEKDSILQWWGSDAFLKRLDTISEGVKDGTCL